MKQTTWINEVIKQPRYQRKYVEIL